VGPQNAIVCWLIDVCTLGRRIPLFLVGCLMLLLVLVLVNENVQILAVITISKLNFSLSFRLIDKN